MSEKRYPLEEGIEFRFVCPGCGAKRVATVPRHSAPFFWRCEEDGCEWTMNIQTDPAGISVGFTAPLPQKPVFRVIMGDLSDGYTDD